jgi:hypothetical protein
MPEIPEATCPETPLAFRKSSYSNGTGECVEVATNRAGHVAVRHSRRPEDGVLYFKAEAWQQFLGWLYR